MSRQTIHALAKSLEINQPAVLVTVIRTNGASPAKVGAQIVLLEDGRTVGTVGGGILEASIISDAKEALMFGQARTKHYRLAEDGEAAIGTLCGGEIDVFLQPYLPPPRLVIVGGGHIGRPLRAIGELAGFDVIVVDVEAGRADVPALANVDLNFDSFIVLITTDHRSDEAALRQVITTSARYIGMIGSLAKCQTILDHLREAGYAEGEIDRIYAPIGLELGGNTPEEIAVAILAEIIAVRKGKHGGFRSRAANQVSQIGEEQT